MDLSPEDLHRIASGAPLGWFYRNRLRGQANSLLLQALLARLALPVGAGEEQFVVDWLADAAAHDWARAPLSEPAALQAVVDGLARQDMTDATAGYDLYALNWFCRHIDAYRRLLLALGAAPLEPLRRLLDGPPRDAIRYFPGETPPYNVTVFGAKLVGLEVVAACGDVSDTARLQRLVAEPAEPPWVRCEAAVLWHRWAGPASIPTIVAACADPNLDDSGGLGTFGEYATRLARLGPDLIPPLVARLGGADYTVRHRASLVLAAMGEPAVEPLATVVRTEEDWVRRQNAEEALAVLDAKRLAAARREREADGRSLSLAPHHEADGRALSHSPTPEEGDTST